MTTTLHLLFILEHQNLPVKTQSPLVKNLIIQVHSAIPWKLSLKETETSSPLMQWVLISNLSLLAVKLLKLLLQKAKSGPEPAKNAKSYSDLCHWFYSWLIMWFSAKPSGKNKLYLINYQISSHVIYFFQYDKGVLLLKYFNCILFSINAATLLSIFAKCKTIE